MASIFKRTGSRKVSLGTQELNYLTENTELKDRDKLRFHFDNFIAKHPKGRISRRDFRELTQNMYPSKDCKGLEKRIFNMYDLNGDGYISFRELMTVMYVMSDGTPEQNLRQIYRVFDTNGDGVVTRKELKNFVKDVHTLFSAQELESIQEDPSCSSERLSDVAWEEMDKDHDGLVTEDEFVEAALGHRKTAALLALKVVQVFDP